MVVDGDPIAGETRMFTVVPVGTLFAVTSSVTGKSIAAANVTSGRRRVPRRGLGKNGERDIRLLRSAGRARRQDERRARLHDEGIDERRHFAKRRCNDRVRGASASGESLAVDRAHVSMWRPSGRRALDALVIPVVGDVAVLAAVFVTDPDEAPDLSRRVLADRFALSPAEARVAKALALGKSVKDIAEAFHLTRETTRWYVKQVLAKTGTSSQAQLVRLLLSMTAPLINPERT